MPLLAVRVIIVMRNLSRSDERREARAKRDRTVMSVLPRPPLRSPFTGGTGRRSDGAPREPFGGGTRGTLGEETRGPFDAERDDQSRLDAAAGADVADRVPSHRSAVRLAVAGARTVKTTFRTVTDGA